MVVRHLGRSRGRAAPAGPIEVADEPRHVTTTSDGSLVAVTTLGPTGWNTSVHDGMTGEQLSPTLPGPNTVAISPTGRLVGATEACCESTTR